MGAFISWAYLQMKAEDLKDQLALTVEGQCLALGNDLVHLPDFMHSLTEEFKARVYSSAEHAYCSSFAEPLLRYASTWAAKEAVFKALKQVSPVVPGWNKIEIIRLRPAGQPFVNLPQAYAAYRINLSISHDGQYVWAIASLCCAQPQNC